MNDDLSESIRSWVNELDQDDGVGLWQIFKEGREHHRLKGDPLMGYVRSCVSILLEAGAVPMTADGRGTCWRPENRYGFGKEEIVENIIQEWFVKRRNDNPHVGDVWFGLPSVMKRH